MRNFNKKNCMHLYIEVNYFYVFMNLQNKLFSSMHGKEIEIVLHVGCEIPLSNIQFSNFK